MTASLEEALTAARRARERAQCRYSGFAVGAALVARGGAVYAGCNVESASYGLTICAERAALATALSEGAASFELVAVITGAAEPTPPCGACRQVLFEYCGDVPVVSETLSGARARWSLGALLPAPFVFRRPGGGA